MASVVVGKVSGSLSKVEFNWEIDEFHMSCMIAEDSLKSPKFTAYSDCSEVQLHLKLYPNGYTAYNKGYLSLYLYASAEIRAAVNFKLLDSKGKAVVDKTMRECALCPSGGRGYGKLISRDFIANPVNGVLNYGKMTVVCETTIFRNKATKRKFEEQEDDAVAPRREVIEKYEALFNGREFSDLSLIAEGKAVKVHKCILASSSSVFAAMLANESPAENSLVEIADIKYDVLKELIRFVYTGRANNVDELAGELAVAADKYALGGLRDKCEKTMMKNLSIDSVVYCLLLADKLRMEKLKDEAIEFIVDKGSDVTDNPEFLLLSHDIVCKVCRGLARKGK